MPSLAATRRDSTQLSTVTNALPRSEAASAALGVGAAGRRCGARHFSGNQAEKGVARERRREGHEARGALATKVCVVHCH